MGAELVPAEAHGASRAASQKPQPSVLLAVSRDEDRAAGYEALSDEGFEVVLAEDAMSTTQFLHGARAMDALVFDLRLLADGDDNTAALRALKENINRTSVFLLVDETRLHLAKEALHDLECDVIPSRTHFSLVGLCIKRNLRRKAKEDVADMEMTALDTSKATKKALEELARAARVDVAVLLKGAKGIESFAYAQRLHSASKRSHRKLVRIDCRHHQHDLTDLLFGTAANTDGLLAQAHGGTLFVEHLDRMPLDAQARLSRFLEERELYVPGRGTIRVDVRLVTTSSADLAKLASENEFRPDLLYRLAGFTVKLPPLSDRMESFDELVARVFEGAQHRIPVITPGAKSALKAYSWPGNDVELELVLQRAVLLAQDAPVDVGHLPQELSPEGGEEGGVELTGPLLSLDDYEKHALAASLKETGGNVTHAAKLLGIGRATFYRKARKYGVAI